MAGPVLITGAAGFLGRHLCVRLAGRHRVAGADVVAFSDPAGRFMVSRVGPGDGLARLAAKVQPAITVHTAFINRKDTRWSDDEYLERVASVDLPLFEVLTGIGSRLLLIGSSAVYGEAADYDPIDERCPLAPVSLYGRAKVAQENQARHAADLGLKVCIVRLFNLIGPGQGAGMLLPDWVRQAVRIKKGETGQMAIRHRRTSRDFVDVRDAADAIAALVEDFQNGEVFNVASGRLVGLRDIGEELQRLCPGQLEFVESEPDVAAGDARAQRGAFGKLRETTGWSPRRDWVESVRDVWVHEHDSAEHNATLET